jgi:hypothetical protein
MTDDRVQQKFPADRQTCLRQRKNCARFGTLVETQRSLSDGSFCGAEKPGLEEVRSDPEFIPAANCKPGNAI